MLARARSIFAKSAAPPMDVPVAPSPASHAGEPWTHWELAPGLELHVRSSLEAGYRPLIDTLLRTAAEAQNLEHQPNTPDSQTTDR